MEEQQEGLSQTQTSEHREGGQAAAEAGRREGEADETPTLIDNIWEGI